MNTNPCEHCGGKGHYEDLYGMGTLVSCVPCKGTGGANILTCIHCGGDGQIMTEVPDDAPIVNICDTCNGSGKSPIQQEKPNGRIDTLEKAEQLLNLIKGDIDDPTGLFEPNTVPEPTQASTSEEMSPEDRAYVDGVVALSETMYKNPDELDKILIALCSDAWQDGTNSETIYSHKQAIEALISHQVKEARREAFADVDRYARSIGDLYTTDYGSRLHDYLRERED